MQWLPMNTKTQQWRLFKTIYFFFNLDCVVVNMRKVQNTVLTVTKFVKQDDIHTVSIFWSVLKRVIWPPAVIKRCITINLLENDFPHIKFQNNKRCLPLLLMISYHIKHWCSISLPVYVYMIKKCLFLQV